MLGGYGSSVCLYSHQKLGKTAKLIVEACLEEMVHQPLLAA